MNLDCVNERGPDSKVRCASLLEFEQACELSDAVASVLQSLRYCPGDILTVIDQQSASWRAHLDLAGDRYQIVPFEKFCRPPQGSVPVALEPRILRTETAAIAALTIVQYAVGDFSL